MRLRKILSITLALFTIIGLSFTLISCNTNEPQNDSCSFDSECD